MHESTAIRDDVQHTAKVPAMYMAQFTNRLELN